MLLLKSFKDISFIFHFLDSLYFEYLSDVYPFGLADKWDSVIISWSVAGVVEPSSLSSVVKVGTQALAMPWCLYQAKHKAEI